MPTRRKKLRHVFRTCVRELRTMHDDIAAGKIGVEGPIDENPTPLTTPEAITAMKTNIIVHVLTREMQPYALTDDQHRMMAASLVAIAVAGENPDWLGTLTEEDMEDDDLGGEQQ